MVDPSPSATITYQWNTTGCYTNIKYNDGKPGCFPHDQTAQNVTDNAVTAEDAGTITCTAVIGGTGYSSKPFTLHVSGTVQWLHIVIYILIYKGQYIR